MRGSWSFLATLHSGTFDKRRRRSAGFTARDSDDLLYTAGSVTQSLALFWFYHAIYDVFCARHAISDALLRSLRVQHVWIQLSDEISDLNNTLRKLSLCFIQRPCTVLSHLRVFVVSCTQKYYFLFHFSLSFDSIYFSKYNLMFRKFLFFNR